MEVLVALVGIACIALIVAVIQIVRYERELRHMAQFLNAQPQHTGARLTGDMRSKRVLDLARAINAQLDKRQQDQKAMLAKDRELRDGFAYLSHDIRTPLMGARGYLQLALEEEDPAEALRYVKAVEERLGSLQTILDQLFLFTRVSSEDYTLEQTEVSLADVLAEVLVAHYPEFEEQGWTPKISIEDTGAEDVGHTGGAEGVSGDDQSKGISQTSLIKADRDALKRIFENLVINMLNHGAGEPIITQQGFSVIFSNRIAHPSTLEADLLFDRFYKGQESAHSKGSGLGLAIVAELAAAMDAQVTAAILQGSDDTSYLQITLTFA